MEGRKVIILGSSRKNGNTTKIVDEISKEHGIEVIDLSDFNISYYDYESKNREDDFLPLIKGILENYDTLIFATPIYWYNMSGIMKVFFDRFSDLLRIEKETGRKLRGKKIGVISNSHDNEIEESFYIPFKKSADYLGMEYLGHAHFNANILNQTTKIELTFI
ncbi:FMN reductase [Flavobacterium sp. Leaf82]|jgi:multimeric flavodoxin WrbA|uniref:flavodoxin family protein n=1 Tax=unclassified Flavobacterium TaxID=196869 RepID=UPI0006F5395B|nr:flavodoxin family protein [Flavobacterium sp. Leaf82]KQO34295.1 FMN reductase [Flavobacterium sp. Leaf82]